jgi:hypothetical protein
MNTLTRILLCFLILNVILTYVQADEITYRRDGVNVALPWYQLQPGVFPPNDAAHEINGELIELDHVNRTGKIRPDRTDAQRRGEWDLPIAFTLLPYGSIRYRGAPAELRDIPIGTHLHGQWFVEPKKEEPNDPKAAPKKNASGSSKTAIEAAFTLVLSFEDDFSYLQRTNRRWRVEAVDLTANTLTVLGVALDSDKVDPKPTVFQLSPATRVWQGRGYGELTDVAVGQKLLLNLTVCTLKGPGRVTDIWLDDESAKLAAARQNEVHRHYIREHGLAAVVGPVDNAAGIMTVTLFGGFDPKLADDIPQGDVVTLAVAEDNLRTWDQINDRKSGPITELTRLPATAGNSGYQLKIKPGMLLEGFRPNRIVRVWSSKWKVDDLPREEKLYQ